MPLPEEHAALLPEEVRSDPGLQSFNDFGGLAKSYLETKSMVGRSIQLPAKEGDQSKWQAETNSKLKEHGYQIGKPPEPPPEKPEAYDFKVDGFDPQVINSDIAVGKFRAFAHKAGMSNAQANGFVEYYAKEIAPAIFAEMQKNDVPIVSDPKEIEAIMGKEFEGEAANRREEAERTLAEFTQARPGLADTIKDGFASYGTPRKDMKLLDNPDFVWLMSEFARANLKQDFGGHVQGSTSADTTASNEANDIMTNPSNPKHMLYRSKDPATVDYVNSLFKKAYGDKEVIANEFLPKIIDRTGTRG